MEKFVPKQSRVGLLVNSPWKFPGSYVNPEITLAVGRMPDLCLLDGTEVLKTNGPSGPGELIKPQKVIAGVDRVAVVSYGARLLDINPEEIFKIRMAHVHGLGEIDLDPMKIQELTL